MSQPLRLLLAQESPATAESILEVLRRNGHAPAWELVTTTAELEMALAGTPQDLVIVDANLPGLVPPRVLELVRAFQADSVLIFLTPSADDDRAVDLQRAGVHDCVAKTRLGRLGLVVARELQAATARRAWRHVHLELERRVRDRTADVQAAHDELQRQLEDRQRLETAVLEATEQERVRIGQELHDNLGQQLTGIALLTRSLEQKLKDKRLRVARDTRRIEALVNQAISHTRELARQLTSVGLANNDLPGALHGLAGHIKTVFNVSCRFRASGRLSTALPEPEARQLYNIAREAVTNAIKHGPARRVLIRLACRDDRLDLVVRNDGLPFAPRGGSGTGMGLRIMHYRASVIGAWLELQPGRKGGTVVRCSLTVKQRLLPGIGGRAPEVGGPG